MNERLMQAIGGVLAAAASRTSQHSTERPGAFWEPGATTDAGTFQFVRQADVTLPDGRVVPGPWLAYRRGAERQRVAPLTGALLSAMRQQWRPGDSVGILTEGSGDATAAQVAEHVRQWGSAYGPVHVLSALTAPTEWGDVWHVPTSGTVVVHSLWMSLAAPQVGAVADALTAAMGRRRCGMVLVMSPGVAQARGLAADQWARVMDALRNGGRVVQA